jgi:hypothetical protein
MRGLGILYASEGAPRRFCGGVHDDRHSEAYIC